VGEREEELAERGRRTGEMSTRRDLTVTRSFKKKKKSTRAKLYVLGFLPLLAA
jgi:hypothetical protein